MLISLAPGPLALRSGAPQPTIEEKEAVGGPWMRPAAAVQKMVLACRRSST